MDARTHLTGLSGQTIYTLSQRRPNRILALEGDTVIVATEELTIPEEAVRSRPGESRSGTVPGVEVLTRPRRVRLGPGAATVGQ